MLFKCLAFCAISLGFLTLSPDALAVEAADDKEAAVMNIPRAAAAVLIEANSGEMLFGINQEIALPPASTTKILTAITALDLNLDMEKKHSISAQAALIGDASLHLRAGEELSLTDLLSGALVHSGNDACYAIAEIAAGSEELFVHWMNMKAAVLGASSVHMTNTNGLPSESHLLSALDLATIAKAAMRNQFFAETVGSQYIELGEGSSYRKYKNTNKLLWQSEHIVGIKTGTTDAAGKCLVAAYEQGDALFISVVLNSPDRFGESMTLLTYAADNYFLFDLPCAGKALAYLPQKQTGLVFVAESDLSLLIKQEQDEQYKLVWQLSESAGSLHIENSAGEVLAFTSLLVNEATEP